MVQANRTIQFSKALLFGQSSEEKDRTLTSGENRFIRVGL
jgi:hypothetical protein